MLSPVKRDDATRGLEISQNTLDRHGLSCDCVINGDRSFGHATQRAQRMNHLVIVPGQHAHRYHTNMPLVNGFNLRAARTPHGHAKLENTVLYRGVDVEDALEFAERTDVGADPKCRRSAGLGSFLKPAIRSEGRLAASILPPTQIERLWHSGS